MHKRNVVVILLALFIIGCAAAVIIALAARDPYGPGDASRVRVTFTGGYETNPVDHGRPVKLIAAALGVPTETFREAFSNVQPAQGGMGPTRKRARENKDVLMLVLALYGISNDRLDEVSNYYRYRPGDGRLWQHEPAVAFAIVEHGKVVRFEIVEAGSGYMTPPRVTVPGHDDVKAVVELTFGQDFKRNGAIEAITIASSTPPP